MIKFKIWRVTFLKSILPLRNLGMDFSFSGNNGNIECASHLRQPIVPSNCVSEQWRLWRVCADAHLPGPSLFTYAIKSTIFTWAASSCFVYHNLSQLMRLWYLSHRRLAKAQASLHIHAGSLQPSLFAHMKYGSRPMVPPKIRHLAPLDGCACAFKNAFTEDEKCRNSWASSFYITNFTFNFVCILAVVMLLLRCCIRLTTSFSSKVLRLSLIAAWNISANHLSSVKERKCNNTVHKIAWNG